MGKCLECGEELIDLPFKKPKKFCGSTCRSNFWQKEQRKKSVTKTKETIQKSPEIKKTDKVQPMVVVAQNRPKTLDELKSMCPEELTGFDRSAWVSKKTSVLAINSNLID